MRTPFRQSAFSTLFVLLSGTAAAQDAPGDSSWEGRRALVYEAHVTNLTTDALALRQIEVLAGGNAPTAELADSALTAVLARLGITATPVDRSKIAGGLRAHAYLWIALADEMSILTRIRHRLTFKRSSVDNVASMVAGGQRFPCMRL